MFSIPIVLFMFRRTSGFEKIISQIRKIKPTKMYLIADGPRNDDEKEECIHCREYVESLINWNCKIIRNYADTNRGVIDNIGGGAIWVFKREEMAIFLEDDNYPEDTFFEYCLDMLNKYKKNRNVLWICGTNYITNMKLNSSYVFTKHLLPCGWASWSEKFLDYYDINLEKLNDEDMLSNFKRSYSNKKLMKQQMRSVKRTRYLIETNRKRSSWDYQMIFSLRANEMFGIAPARNQIKNIGADEYSVHGGTSIKKTMTDRFCMVNTSKLKFPLVDPKKIEICPEFEKKIGNIILLPLEERIKILAGSFVKIILKINKYESLVEYIKSRK